MARRNRKNKQNAAPTNNKTTREQRSANTSTATAAIYTVSKMVDLLKPYELDDSRRFRTYQQMLRDDSVWHAIESRISAIEVAQSRPKLTYNKNSERSQYLHDFLKFNIAGMNKTTRQFGRDAAEMTYNGLAPFEIVTKNESGNNQYKGMFTLKDLVYIDPLTLDPTEPFITKNGGREVAYWRQLGSAFKDNDGLLTTSLGVGGVITIDARKMAVTSYAASSGRPLGESALDAAYVPWREKVLIQEYLLMGIQKDLAGTPVLRVPQALMDDAQNDSNGPAARTLSQLKIHMQNLHAGDQTFVMLPSDTWSETGTGNQIYDINFKGVDGNNKNFNLPEILEQKKKAIYNALSASDLITGETGGGSFNLLEGKTSSRIFMSQRDNIIIDEMWNKRIIPLLLRLNGFTDEDPSDIPVYKHGPIAPVSLEEVGKYWNRVGRFIPCVPDVLNAIMEGNMDVDYRVPDDLSPDECRELLFSYEEPQKNSTGEGSSGTGNSQDGGGASDTNDENK